jgi:hypothetical protein
MRKPQKGNYAIPESEEISILERFFATDFSSASNLHISAGIIEIRGINEIAIGDRR